MIIYERKISDDRRNIYRYEKYMNYIVYMMVDLTDIKQACIIGRIKSHIGRIKIYINNY